MANQYPKLIIDGQEVDLYKSKDGEALLPLNITKRVNNIEGETQGDFSRASITVPATKNNVLTLGDNRSFKPFRIEVDGQPSFNGNASTRKGGTYNQGYGSIKENYQINLISKNSSWFVLLGETKLSDLTDLVILWNFPILTLGWISDPAVRDYGFTFIKWREWANSTGAAPNLQYLPSQWESTPLLYLVPFIHAAYNSIGYTVISDWMQTDYASKLTMDVPLPEKMPKGYNDEYLNTEVSLTAPFALPIITQNFPFDTITKAAPQNPTAYDNVVNFNFTAPQSGYCEVVLELTFAQPAPIPPYFALSFLQLNGVNVQPIIGFAFDDAGASAPYPTAGTTIRASSVVFAAQNDTISYTIVGTANVTVNSGTCKFIMEATPTPGENFPINFKFLLGTNKFLDMLLGLRDMHNLAFETDDDRRTVTIEPKDGYVTTKRPSTTTLKEGFYRNESKDYSQLVDHKKKGSYEYPTTAGRYDYKYASDSDETIEWIEKGEDFKIYESRFQMSSGADESSRSTKIVPFFAKTIHVLDHLTRFPKTNTSPQFPLIYETNYVLDPTSTTKDVDKTPRIFYFAGQRFGGTWAEDDGLFELFEFPGAAFRNPVAFMINWNDTTGLDPNLGFNNQIVNGILSIGLTQRYHLQDLVRRDRGKLVKNYIKHNSIDELNFSFRIKGILSSQKYIVQNLTGFNPLVDAPTNFTFWLDVFPSQGDADKIQNSPLVSFVTLLSS